MLCSCGELAEERANPVGVRMEQRVLVILVERNVLGRESRNVSSPCDTGVIFTCLVIQFSILCTIQIARQGRGLLEGGAPISPFLVVMRITPFAPFTP